MRKLASIQRIKEVLPIDGADRIELVKVLGWQCVANKGVFKEGDLCVYFEIDSFLPMREEFDFLRGNSYRKNDYMGEGYRLKTMKFKGEISQGLVLPVSTFAELQDVKEKDDVTEQLHVREWSMPEEAGNGGTMLGDRPSFIPYTDETRIQSMPSLFNEFQGIPYYITTKMDGSSHSVGLKMDDDGEIEVRYTGHKREFKDDGNCHFIEYVKPYIDKMKAYMKENGISEMVLQGEWCGAGIQKNRLKLQSPTWFVFTVNIQGKRVGLAKLEEICERTGLTMVPLEETGNDLTITYMDIEALLLRAGQGEGYNHTTREGIVIRPIEPVYSKTLSAPLSMKVINNKYLLKDND